MPVEPAAAVRPFVVELGVVVLHIRPDKVGRRLDRGRSAGEVKECLVVVHRTRDPLQPRGRRRVAALENEGRIGVLDRPAALDELRCRLA